MSSRLIPASQVAPAALGWLWRDRIPRGALTELIGGPGQAKSATTYDLAARVTAGAPMPGCTDVSAPASVILLQAEDHPASRVIPSLVAAGADLARVHLWDRSQDGGRPLRFPDDIGVLDSAAARLGARLIVLDPVSCYLGGSMQNEQSVRKALMPLAALAENRNLSVLMVRHLRKSGARDPIHLGAGSIAFVALVRSSLLVGNDPTSEDNHRHVLTLNKSNLASAPSLLYRTVRRGEAAIAIEWLGETEIVARDLALGATSASEASALREAMYVLYSLLAEGALPANEVARRAAQGRVSGRTLYRAKVALKVRSIKRGSGKGSRWYWRLPDDDRTYRAFKRHDHDRLMEQLCHGPSETDLPDSFTDLPGHERPGRDNEDDGQLV